MRLRSALVALFPLTLSWACSSSATSDAGAPADAAPGTDAAVAADVAITGDAAASADAAPGEDAAPGADASASDSGEPLLPGLVPGASATFSEGRVNIGDTRSDVVARLGAGSRSPGTNTRSYEYSLSGGSEVTIWYANSNLDADDNPPNDVDPTDQVLWIAVSGSFAGQTPEGLGIGSTRASGMSAYGASARSLPITTGSGGVLDTYYTRGLLVAYDPSDLARTITVTRAYLKEPDGRIDIGGGRLVFGGNSITGSLLQGSTRSSVETLLGPPDAHGPLTIGSVAFEFYSYSFIGFEIYFVGTTDLALFVSLHSPYYGTTAAPESLGIGSARADWESYLGAQGFGAEANSVIPGVKCRKNSSGKAVGYTYSAQNPDEISSIIVAHPGGNSCP